MKRIAKEKAVELCLESDNKANFPIPEGWAWTTLGAVVKVVMGQSPPGDTYNKSGDGVPLLNGPVEKKGIDMGRGIAFPSVSRKQIEDLSFPLPPLAEQHRIVAKVDELMTLCDRLEASLVTGDDIRRRLLDALLAQALELGNDSVLAKGARIAAHG